ncbi:MAG TPA: hypothetical protein VMB50_12780 [Myxococcales bacterium]|nr:hypothetical protein [Myxococcales bacterium]
MTARLPSPRKRPGARRPRHLVALLALAACLPTNIQADGSCDISEQCASGLACLATSTGQGPCNGPSTARQFCTLPCSSDADCADLPAGDRIHLIWTCVPSCTADAGACRTFP